ncbi:hypothetical protein LINPERPRIM_LOCUS37516, partial [Linum perenne]
STPILVHPSSLYLCFRFFISVGVIFDPLFSLQPLIASCASTRSLNSFPSRQSNKSNQWKEQDIRKRRSGTILERVIR